MPSATETTTAPETTIMRQSGSLDVYEQRIANPAIGVEFPNIDLVEIMESPDADRKLRDLGIMSKFSISRTKRSFKTNLNQLPNVEL
jgi:hypothetical protein